MIRHAAIFGLKHPQGSAEEKSFLAALAVLRTIPGVGNFEIARHPESSISRGTGRP